MIDFIPDRMLEDSKSTARSRGERVQLLRKMAGLTRQGFEAKFRISASTIQSWESAKAGGLTERGARRILPLFQEIGIYCTLDWLLHAIGNPPQFTAHNTGDVKKISGAAELSESAAIIQELLTFRRCNKNAIDFIVSDDGLLPYYKQGDYVAGIMRPSKHIPLLIGLDCIVQTKSNEILLRRIRRSSLPDCYDLYCTNINTELAKPILYNQPLLFAAPVVWHRRQDAQTE